MTQPASQLKLLEPSIALSVILDGHPFRDSALKDLLHCSFMVEHPSHEQLKYFEYDVRHQADEFFVNLAADLLGIKQIDSPSADLLDGIREIERLLEFNSLDVDRLVTLALDRWALIYFRAGLR